MLALLALAGVLEGCSGEPKPEDLGARRLLAIHLGTFDLADEPIEEPPRRLEAESSRRGLGPERVWIFRPGETRTW